MASPAKSRLRSAGGDELDPASLSESLAQLGDGYCGSFARGPHVHDQRFQRPEPQVVLAPPGRLIQERRVDATADHRSGVHAVPRQL